MGEGDHHQHSTIVHYVMNTVILPLLVNMETIKYLIRARLKAITLIKPHGALC